jgi:hypothetical protein
MMLCAGPASALQSDADREQYRLRSGSTSGTTKSEAVSSLFFQETGSKSGTQADHGSWRVHVDFWQLRREKSPVALRSEIRGNSGQISKADFENDTV